MKALIENYGMAILAMISTILIFTVLFTFSYSIANYGEVNGLNGILGAEIDSQYADDIEVLSPLQSSEEVPFTIQQDLRRRKSYMWYEVIIPENGYGDKSFALISLRNIDTDIMYHVDIQNVQIDSEGNTIFTFPDDGLYQMRFRLINDADGSEELGIASVYVRKGINGNGD